MNLNRLQPGDLILCEWQERFVMPSKNYATLQNHWLRIEERIENKLSLHAEVIYLAKYYPEDNDSTQLELDKPVLFFKLNGWIPGVNFVTARKRNPEFLIKTSLPDI